jgi:hypothetical protein
MLVALILLVNAFIQRFFTVALKNVVVSAYCIGALAAFRALEGIHSTLT